MHGLVIVTVQCRDIKQRQRIRQQDRLMRLGVYLKKPSCLNLSSCLLKPFLSNR